MAKKPPQNGLHIAYRSNRSVHWQIDFKDGKKNGKEIRWFANGQKEAETVYKNGKRDGECTLWQGDGRKKAYGFYKDGKRVDTWTYYYEDGYRLISYIGVEKPKLSNKISYPEKSRTKPDIFKIEDYSTVRLINAQWLGGIHDLITIRNNNKKNHRLINSGIPISLEEMDLFIDWVEQGKDRKELEDFFQRKIFSVDQFLRKYKEKKKNRGIHNYKLYSFKNNAIEEIKTDKKNNTFKLEFPKNHRKHWKPNSKEEMVNKYKNGSTIPELAKHFERTAGSITSILFEKGLIDKDDFPTPPTAQQKQEDNVKHGRPKNHGLEWDSQSLDELINKYKNGLSLPELAEYFERSLKSIEAKLPKKGVEKEITVSYKRGQLVQQPKNKDWGNGIVLNVNNTQIKILYEKAGFQEFKFDSNTTIPVIKALSDSEFKQITGKWLLKQKGVTSLWHITHRDNIKDILLNGILCHFTMNKFKGLTYTDISNQGVQARRIKLDEIYNQKLHKYVPLYINPKNAMLFALQKRYQNRLCLIEVSLNVLINRYIFTDGNAAKNITNFYSDLETEHENIPWNDVFSERWVEGNTKYVSIMSHMQSELLIDQKIESKFIKKIHCHSQETVDFVNNNLKPHNDYIKAVNIEINSNAFF